MSGIPSVSGFPRMSGIPPQALHFHQVKQYLDFIQRVDDRDDESFPAVEKSPGKQILAVKIAGWTKDEVKQGDAPARLFFKRFEVGIIQVFFEQVSNVRKRVVEKR